MVVMIIPCERLEDRMYGYQHLRCGTRRAFTVLQVSGLACSVFFGVASGWALYKRLPRARTQDYTNKNIVSYTHLVVIEHVCRSLLRTQVLTVIDSFTKTLVIIRHPAIISCMASPRPLSNYLVRRPTGALLGSSHTLLRTSARMDDGRHSQPRGSHTGLICPTTVGKAIMRPGPV